MLEPVSAPLPAVVEEEPAQPLPEVEVVVQPPVNEEEEIEENEEELL